MLNHSTFPYGHLLGENILQQGWRYGCEEALTETQAKEQLARAGLKCDISWPTLIGHVVESSPCFCKAIFRTHDGEFRVIKWRAEKVKVVKAKEKKKKKGY